MFYEDWPFGKAFYHEGGADDSSEEETGNYYAKLTPSEKYDLDEQIGEICWQGSDFPPETFPYKGLRFKVDSPKFLVNVFKAWQDNRRTVVVRLPAKDLDILKKFVAEHDGWDVKA